MKFVGKQSYDINRAFNYNLSQVYFVDYDLVPLV